MQSQRKCENCVVRSLKINTVPFPYPIVCQMSKRSDNSKHESHGFQLGGPMTVKKKTTIVLVGYCLNFRSGFFLLSVIIFTPIIKLKWYPEGWLRYLIMIHSNRLPLRLLFMRPALHRFVLYSTPARLWKRNYLRKLSGDSLLALLSDSREQVGD